MSRKKHHGEHHEEHMDESWLVPYADIARKKGHKVYHLNIGQPDIKTPEVALQAVKNADIDGFTDNTAKEIVIRTDNVNNVGDFDFLQKKQLRHEIIHAFLSESGLQCNWQHMEQFGHDETTVDWFAIQSPKIFEVFKELELI